MRYAAAVLCLLMGLSIAVQGLAQDDAEKKHFFYQWTDEKGVVHITDGLGKVPEKHRSKARQLETTKPGEEDAEPAAPSFYPPAPQPEVDEEALKDEWRSRITEWRERLAEATERRDRLQKERDGLFAAWGSSALAPIAARQRAEEIDRDLERARKEIDEAQRMLTVVIPDEARRAGVPPGWLRE
ncbi:MAG: hypothetical protein A2X56_04650 [Nitrospirae bacterium GWC2_57_13]|nr:MAG: hypothetical protein A2X56_04650 [Nitrospirae bacterium GWC2_57_13]OGW44226.1 MAG: hypothetical protein A2X57_11745 [Nitrospirae bacterium GWD2_57_8]